MSEQLDPDIERTVAAEMAMFEADEAIRAWDDLPLTMPPFDWKVELPDLRDEGRP